MKIKKKDIVIFTSVFLLLLLVVGGTYAYWTWNSEENKNVVFNSIGEIEDYIVYDEGLSYFVGNFKPYETFCQSANTTLSFYKTSEAYEADLTATIYMDVNSIGTDISASSDVYWIITAGDSSISCGDGFNSSSVINYGTFNGINAGETITLVSNLQVGTVEQEFTVWIWIDKSSSNLSSLSGETVDTNIWTQIDMYSNNSEVPRLDYGMIPVTIANNGTVTTIGANSRDWYDYRNKEWANAILVTKSSRSTYMNTSGVVVNPSDILAYYVWIPRYKYRIPGIKCSTLENPTIQEYPECYAPYTVSDEDRTKLLPFVDAYITYRENRCGTSDLDAANIWLDESLKNGILSTGQSVLDLFDAYTNGSLNYCDYVRDGTTVSYISSGFNPNNTIVQESTIDIVFEGSSLPMSLGDAKKSYRTHPAFWWDNDSDEVVDEGEMVAGIWVGKFEATGDGNLPTVRPNLTSLGYLGLSEYFNTSLKFASNDNVYGLSNVITDSHMMKNTEWGAVLYLSHSLYGINGAIRVNNNTNYITGCGAITANAEWIAECQISYGSGVSSYPQSTTGNITGVFDMVGGAADMLMAFSSADIEEVKNQSGFTVLPDKKYYDSYLRKDPYVTFSLQDGYGQAMLETLGWYNMPTPGMPYDDYAILERGGYAGLDDEGKNNPFFFTGFQPTANGVSNVTGRYVLVIGHDS